MRSLRIALVVSTIALIFLFSGLVSALNPDEASISISWLNQTIRPGDTASVVITFTSQSSDQLSIQRVGFHFDWMSENEFYTSDLSDNPVIIPSSGSQAFEPMVVQIPPFVSAGSHSYYVGIDGVQGSSGTSFAWDSPSQTVQIYAASEKAPTATPTSSPNSGGGQGEGSSLPLYLAVIGAVVIVALLVIIVMMRRKRKPTDSTMHEPPKNNAKLNDNSEYSI